MYAGNLGEGGSYVIAVVTVKGYNGQLAYAAVNSKDNNSLFVNELDKAGK